MNQPLRNPIYIDTAEVVFPFGGVRLIPKTVLLQNNNGTVQTVVLREREAVTGTGTGVVSGASTYKYTLPASAVASSENYVGCIITSNSADALIIGQDGVVLYLDTDVGSSGAGFDADWSIAGRLLLSVVLPANSLTEIDVCGEEWRGLDAATLPSNVTARIVLDRTGSRWDRSAKYTTAVTAESFFRGGGEVSF